MSFQSLPTRDASHSRDTGNASFLISLSRQQIDDQIEVLTFQVVAFLVDEAYYLFIPIVR